MKRLLSAILMAFLAWTSLSAQSGWHKSAGVEHVSTVTFTDFSGMCFAGTVDSGVYMSQDKGLSWIPRNNGILLSGPLLTVNSFAHSGSLMYAALGHALGGGIFTSADAGASWSATVFPTGATAVAAIDSILCASTGSYYFIYGRSTDWGASWVYTTLPFGLYLFNYREQNGTLYAVSLSEGLVRSEDAGESWQSLGFAGTFCFDYLLYGETIIVSTAEGIYLSDDLGLSWSQVNTGGMLEDATRIMTLEMDDNTVIAASDTAIYYTFLAGSGVSAWTRIPGNGLPLLDTVHIIGPVHYTEGRLMIGTCDLSKAGTSSPEKGMGIWYFTGPLTSSVQQEKSHNPVSVFPIPASSSLHITLPDGTDEADITLRNGVGAIVTTSETCNSSCTVDVSGLPSGMYFVEILSDHLFEERRIIVQH